LEDEGGGTERVGDSTKFGNMSPHMATDKKNGCKGDQTMPLSEIVLIFFRSHVHAYTYRVAPKSKPLSPIIIKSC